MRSDDHPALLAPLQGGELGKARANKKMWDQDRASGTPTWVTSPFGYEKTESFVYFVLFVCFVVQITLLAQKWHYTVTVFTPSEARICDQVHSFYWRFCC